MNATPARTAPRWRRVLRRVGFGAAVMLFATAGVVMALRAWVTLSPSEDAPVVVLSIGADLINDVGLHQASYQTVLTALGARTVEVSPRDRRSPAEILKHADALVLTGGGDVDPALSGADPDTAALVDPARDAFETALLAEAIARDLPVLAVCRGHQLLNVMLGGTLRDLRAEPALAASHGITAKSLVAHEVALSPASQVAATFAAAERARVNSFHAQAIDDLAEPLVVTAVADDGVIEAVELPGKRFVVGVQWHPELMAVSHAPSRALFQALLDAGAP